MGRSGSVRRAAAVVAGLLACSTLGVLDAGPAAAATSYWTVYNRSVTRVPLCLTAGPVNDRVVTGVCDGSVAQDWAFVNWSGGEYLVSRAHPGYVLAASAVAAGAYLTVEELDLADAAQVFVAGDPVARERNHLRPRDAVGLCLERLTPWENRAAVVLAGCNSLSSGGQVWSSTFSGNH